MRRAAILSSLLSRSCGAGTASELAEPSRAEAPPRDEVPAGETESSDAEAD